MSCTPAAEHFFSLHMAGTNWNINCISTGAVFVKWLYDNDQLVSSANGSSVSLRLKVNDSIHHRVYICRGYLADLSYSEVFLSIIVHGKADACNLSLCCLPHTCMTGCKPQNVAA